MKKKINKKPLIFIFVLLILTVIGGTFAYLYTEIENNDI